MDFYKILSRKKLFIVFLFGFLVVIKLFSFVVGLFDDLPLFMWIFGIKMLKTVLNFCLIHSLFGFMIFLVV